MPDKSSFSGRSVIKFGGIISLSNGSVTKCEPKKKQLLEMGKTKIKRFNKSTDKNLQIDVYYFRLYVYIMHGEKNPQTKYGRKYGIKCNICQLN